jgi:hypothetical protein
LRVFNAQNLFTTLNQTFHIWLPSHRVFNAKREVLFSDNFFKEKMRGDFTPECVTAEGVRQLKFGVLRRVPLDARKVSDLPKNLSLKSFCPSCRRMRRSLKINLKNYLRLGEATTAHQAAEPHARVQLAYLLRNVRLDSIDNRR